MERNLQQNPNQNQNQDSLIRMKPFFCIIKASCYLSNNDVNNVFISPSSSSLLLLNRNKQNIKLVDFQNWMIDNLFFFLAASLAKIKLN